MKYNAGKYDVAVIGAGHAGCEAALATARMGFKTLLFSISLEAVANMPCNPHIGGSSKGHLVKELDCLGGEMGKNIDKTFTQLRMLNTSKGPAVYSLRAQADKKAYPRYMQKVVKEQENLDLIEGMVEDLVIEDQTVKGVILDDGTTYLSKTVILTTGTYLKAEILVGHSKHASGPDQQKESKFLSGKLKDYGFRIQRLKTGTPPRVEINSIDYSKTSLQPGTNAKLAFSFTTDEYVPIEKQTPCYLTYTTEETHKIILENLHKSSMYGGLNDIKGIGPRYCPSIEDKVVRFKDKERHQIFLEPESNYYDDIYIQGFSTSMPHDIQEKMVHSLPGLENAKILKYAYAIEYDAIYPTQLKQSLETKLIENLYTAGQINGTSGYEEAACQGLIAGINASLKIENKEPLILKRNEAYIGVLIDDLVTKGIRDPYRLLTSRAEYRLLLRHDNADLRLGEIGKRVGLLSNQRYEKLLQKKKDINDLMNLLKESKITPTEEINSKLSSIPTSPIKDGIKLYELLKRPEVRMEHIKYFIDIPYSEEVVNQVEINIKYEGYILKEEVEAEKMLKLENKPIPEGIDYYKIHNLASEAKQKLSEVRPTSIGQAIRISGVNPADISILSIYIKKEYFHEN